MAGVSLPSAVVRDLDPATFQRHPLNSEAAAWPETNCYIDVWLPLLHSLGLDPVAMLPFCLAVDFEGDHWTFAKPSLDDIWTLYRIDVQELNLWNSPIGQTAEQVRRGNAVLIELDSYYLPDTRGTAYQSDHTKTTACVNEIDPAGLRMRYFHNGGYFEMAGDDFAAAMRLSPGENEQSAPLAPYAEFAKIDRRVAMPPSELRATSFALAKRHLERRPLQNPFTRWRAQFVGEMDSLAQRPSEYYHRYAFANLRQIGASFQLASAYLRWLDADAPGRFEEPARAFAAISEASKVLMFKIARAMNRKKTLSDNGQLDEMADAWNLAFRRLPDLFSRSSKA